MNNLVNRRVLGLLAASSLSLALGACAEQSGPPTSVPMQLGAATMAPRGYLQFCLRRPDQCGLQTPVTQIRNEALQAALNREEWSNVLSVGRAPVQTAVVVSASAPQTLRATVAQVAANDVQPAPGAEAPEAEVHEIAGLGAANTEKPLEVELQPAPAAQPQHDAGVTVSISIVKKDDAPVVRPAKLAEPRTGAPKLDDLFEVVHRAAPTVLHYNPALWAHLETVNVEINARIKPRSDVEAFGVDDYWALPLEDGGRAEGNCKHYALEKRRELVEAGMSEDALSLAILRTPQGEMHAVLIVATDRGDFVLDNLTPEIRGWRDTGYTWLARQTPGDPLRWASVERAAFGG